MPAFSALSENPLSVSEISLPAPVNLTGVSSTGAIGDVTLPNASARLVGVAATGAVDSEDIVVHGSASVYPTGIRAFGYVGQIRIWGKLQPDVAASYSEITGSSQTWEETTPAVAKTWDNVA